MRWHGARLPVRRAGALLQLICHRQGDALHKVLVFIGEDVAIPLLPGHEQIGQGIANGVSNLTQIEVTLMRSDFDLHRRGRQRAGHVAEQRAPLELELLILRRVDEAL